jgi:hypothetical protein
MRQFEPGRYIPSSVMVAVEIIFACSCERTDACSPTFDIGVSKHVQPGAGTSAGASKVFTFGCGYVDIPLAAFPMDGWVNGYPSNPSIVSGYGYPHLIIHGY